MLAILAAASVISITPSGETLSPAEAVLQQRAMSQILANPARHCRAAKASAQAAAQPPIRCRPAPYHVASRGDRPKPQRLVMTGSRVPVTERRQRPCLLMEAPATPQSSPMITVAASGGRRAAD